MGVAAYNRGSRLISRQIAMEHGGLDPDRPYIPTPRPAGFGDKALAKAVNMVRHQLKGAQASAERRGEPFDRNASLDYLVDYLWADLGIARSTARKAVDIVRGNP